jgi:hypothetical protein
MRIPRDIFAPAAALAVVGVNQYGDATDFTLPSTGLQVFVATEYVMRAPESDRRLAVAPDVPIAVTSADFFAERDPVLDRALRGL